MFRPLFLAFFAVLSVFARTITVRTPIQGGVKYTVFSNDSYVTVHDKGRLVLSHYRPPGCRNSRPSAMLEHTVERNLVLRFDYQCDAADVAIKTW